MSAATQVDGNGPQPGVSLFDAFLKLDLRVLGAPQRCVAFGVRHHDEDDRGEHGYRLEKRPNHPELAT